MLCRTGPTIRRKPGHSAGRAAGTAVAFTSIEYRRRVPSEGGIMSVSSINASVTDLLKVYREEQIRNAETRRTPLQQAVERAADPRQAAGGAPAFEEVVTPTEDGFAAQSRFTGRDGRTFEGSAEVRTTEDVEVQANFEDGRGNRIELNAAVSDGRLDVNAVRTDAQGQTQAVQQNQARRLFGRGTVLDFAA
jgi:hypothetical protein